MSWIQERQGMWIACYYGEQGKKIRKSTKIAVAGGSGLSKSQAKKAAERFAEALEAADKGIASDRVIRTVQAQLEAAGIARKMSVRECLADYVNYTYTRKVSPVTQANARTTCRQFEEWLGAEADQPVYKLTPTRCFEHLKYLRDVKNLSLGTLKARRAHLNLAFKRAEYNELIVRNPMNSVSVRMLEDTRPKQKIESFTMEEIQLLKEKLPNNLRRLMLLSLFTGGQRLGDCCRMRWEYINLPKRRIDFTTGKTKRSMCLPISSQLMSLLKEIKAEHRALGIDSPFLFPEFGGERQSYSRVSHEFASYLLELGIVKPCKRIAGRGKARHTKCFHSLRHTAVTILRSNPAFSPDLIRDTVGHSNEEVERGYYSATMEAKARLLEHLGATQTA